MGLGLKLNYLKFSFSEVKSKKIMLKVMFLMFLALGDDFFVCSFEHL